jgi:hypothetical protein
LRTASDRKRRQTARSNGSACAVHDRIGWTDLVDAAMMRIACQEILG